jgi:ribonuclease Z
MFSNIYMKITFLGTACMQPTKERNLQGIFVSHKEDTLLVDCGEGTQRQLRIAKLKPTKITRILITHVHVDHTLGLGGLVRYLDANGFTDTLEIYGPKGIKETCKCLITGLPGSPTFPIKIKEISTGLVFESKNLEVHAAKLNHGIDCVGYSIKEKDRLKINLKYLAKFGLTQDKILGKLQEGKDIVWNGKKITAKKGTTLIEGKKVSFVLDTAYCKNAVKISKNSDLLVCESTFSEKDKANAKEKKHLTSVDAARIAKESKSKKLVLTHFSQRYKEVLELKKEAKKVFKNVHCSNDFDSFEV